jgi:hypothetical protein
MTGAHPGTLRQLADAPGIVPGLSRPASGRAEGRP